MATNAERREKTRTALISAAREEFAAHGFADAATNAIVARAGATRGAMYHHFKDKLALFDAVVEAEEKRLGDRIDADTEDEPDAFQGLVTGIDTYLDAATDPATRRIILLDGPAVLGWRRWREIQARHSLRTLREGLEASVTQGTLAFASLAAATSMLSAALDEAAHFVADADDPAAARAEVRATAIAMLEGFRKA